MDGLCRAARLTPALTMTSTPRIASLDSISPFQLRAQSRPGEKVDDASQVLSQTPEGRP